MTTNLIEKLVRALTGKYIALEGLDGSGKTTLTNYIKDLLAEQLVLVREPGGTLVGEEIRQILLNGKGAKLQPLTELMLFSACRIEILYQIALPSLADNKTIWSDRCYWSTYAYQCYHNKMFTLEQFNDFMTNIYKDNGIDIFIYCQIDPQVGLTRAGKMGEADNFESRGLEYYQQTAQGYNELVTNFKASSDLLAKHTNSDNQTLWTVYQNPQTQKVLIELDANLISQEQYGQSLVEALLVLAKD